MKHTWKVMAAMALMAGAAALTLPASWVSVSAGPQVQSAPVALRTTSGGSDEIVAPGVVVSRGPVVVSRAPAVDLPEELSLLLVGAVLVGLAGMLRRARPDEKNQRGPRRSHISGVAAPGRTERVEPARRSS